MPLPLLLAAAAAPAIAKGLLGMYQLSQHVNRQDTTTPQEQEMMQNARQMQAAQLPGLAQYQAQLGQGQNAALQSAALGSGGASDYLAAVSAANRIRNNGEQQLVTQGQQYHTQANQQMNQVLNAAAQHEQADTNRALQANAALKGAGLNNISNGLTEGSSVAAYGLSQDPLNAAGSYGMPGINPKFNQSLRPSIYGPGDYNGPMNLYNRRSSMYDSGVFQNATLPDSLA